MLQGIYECKWELNNESYELMVNECYKSKEWDESSTMWCIQATLRNYCQHWLQGTNQPLNLPTAIGHDTINHIPIRSIDN